MLNIDWDNDQRAWILRSSVTLPTSRDTLFSFFSDAFQLEQITPQWLNFRILTPPPIDIKTGTLIDYSLRLRGFPIRWRTEISSWDPPYSFIDRQLKGPYSLWEHLHTFDQVEGGTLVSDQVRYRVPGGALTHYLFVKSELLKIFSYRQQQMLKLFDNADHTSVSSAVDAVTQN
jgi:ligand-binding SRPBCC domain-containing protein